MVGKGDQVSVGKAKSRSKAALRLSNSHIHNPGQLFMIEED